MIFTMNPIQVKLKVYAYSIAALSVISLVLRAICLLFAFDENLHYFSYTSPLPAIANAILVLSLVWAASSFVFIPRGTLRPVLPELSTPSVFACALCGFIFLFFGGQATKQCVIYTPAMSAVAVEFTLVEVENAEDVEKAEAILQGRIDSQIAGGAWYPETIEGWENNSRLAVNGNSLMLVVYEDADAIVESFNALFA